MKQRLLLIGGSTAVGKSKFAQELSKYLKMEIISADSVQVYKDLNLGTSKPTPEEKAICNTHLVDIKNYDEKFNAFDFVISATKAIEDISRSGKLPVIVGGTGLYMEALLFSYSFNKQKENNESKYDFKLYVLNQDREKLYSKINLRVDQMIENGLIDEVKALKEKGLEKTFQSMQAIGYKEIFAYLDGELTLNEALDKMKQATRNYAKRQITWFKHMPATWIDVDTQWQESIEKIVDEFSEYKK